MQTVSVLVPGETCRQFSSSSGLEWLLPNGIGGFAMGTVAGVNTRRYHGHLVASIDGAESRMVLLAGIEALATVGKETFGVSTNQYVGAIHPQSFRRLSEFRLGDVAEWTFHLDGAILVKRLGVHKGQNAVTVTYTNEGASGLALSLRPLVSHKFYHENFRAADFYPDFLTFGTDETVLVHHGVDLVIGHTGATRIPTTGWYYRFEHERETERGLDPVDDHFCPCELTYFLEPGGVATISASTEQGTEPMALHAVPSPSGQDVARVLSAAAEKFLVRDRDRHAVIAGYPWFTDWGRDTMISVPGLCLETGRVNEAKEIIRGYAAQMHQGLLPNRFRDNGEGTDTNTVDATLWFANAVYLTLESAWDESFAQEALAWLHEIVDWHQRGTLFGIKVDPEDGLLAQGEQGVQLTWMDAKVGDWVVTPRHGKPVEINGLWVNLLNILVWLQDKVGEDSSALKKEAERAGENMADRFWHDRLGYYLDTVDPADASLRPNQVIAMALPFSPLVGERAVKALAVVENELLTPFGLRSLGPREPAYVGNFDGPLAQRDAAYHQGTAWPYLLGSYVAAVLKLTGDVERANLALAAVPQMLENYGLGGIAEVYDGDSPQWPGGCPFQAWSVAEVLRAVRLVERSHANAGKAL